MKALLLHMGEDPKRPGLIDTPRRVVDAMMEFTSAAGTTADALLARTFECVTDELVCVSGISFVSLCEHHLQPFAGSVGVAYRPTEGVVVGLSKLARTVDVYAKRLQLQERMTHQIAGAIDRCVSPDVAVVVEATHSCLAHRGARRPGAVMRTSAMLGIFRRDASARAEALKLLS